MGLACKNSQLLPFEQVSDMSQDTQMLRFEGFVNEGGGDGVGGGGDGDGGGGMRLADVDLVDLS